MRFRPRLVRICPLVALAVLLALGGVASAQAADLAAPDLSWLALDESCPDGASVAALDAPEWLAGIDQADAAAPAGAGSACSTNPQCKDRKQYCAKAAGDCKGKGECKARPDVCTEIFKPVCGCNGKTFSNECFAAAAGVNVKSEGACVPTGKTAAMACKTNANCKAAGSYCAKDTGKCNDEGVCAQRPEICPTIVAPVCGCNGKTFNNGCEANRAGVNVRHDGKC
jgi:Kazal-type serine protease inhibitor domain